MDNLIGKVGLVKSSLRPFGEVEVENATCEARSEHGWLDRGTRVVVVKSELHGLVVRPADESEDTSIPPSSDTVSVDQPSTCVDKDHRRSWLGFVFDWFIFLFFLAEPLRPGHGSRQEPSPAIPLEGPRLWLEEIRVKTIGAVLGVCLSPLLLWTGVPLNWEVVLLPIGGWLNGAILQYFLRFIRDFHGPYADHRPAAYFCVASGAIASVVAMIIAVTTGSGLGVISLAMIAGMLMGIMAAGVFVLLG